MFDRQGGTPLCDALQQHAVQGRASFHTPGHKGRLDFGGAALDLTELPDTGSLYDGGDAIEVSECLYAEAFGAGATFYSAGGCTLCIQTMLSLGCGGTGGRILMARNAHRSAVNAAVLLDLDPLWLWPEAGGQPTVENLDEKLKTHLDIQAVYITSPNYAGQTADVAGMAALCHDRGVPLLVDNAHGSHLGAFGMHPLALGADMTADSAHKTLPVLTGGAVLHLSKKWTAGKDSVALRREVKAAMALFGSTSPAFPVLASLDRAQDWWRREGPDAYRQTAVLVKALRGMAIRAGYGIQGDERADPTRLTLHTVPLGLSGLRAAKAFRRLGCEPEYADKSMLVFIVTPFNTEEELDRLGAAIQAVPGVCREKDEPQAFDPFACGIPLKRMSPRMAALLPSEEIPSGQAAGRIAARTVCPCPPGIPAVVPGEEIGPELADLLSAWGIPMVTVVRETTE